MNICQGNRILVIYYLLSNWGFFFIREYLIYVGIITYNNRERSILVGVNQEKRRRNRIEVACEDGIRKRHLTFPFPLQTDAGTYAYS